MDNSNSNSYAGQFSAPAQSPRRKNKRGLAPIIILFVVGTLLTLSFPLAYTASFLLAICFCVMFPFLLPLAAGDGDNEFENVFQGMLDDFVVGKSTELVILTVIGVGLLITAIVLLFRRKRALETPEPVLSVSQPITNNLDQPTILSQPTISATPHKNPKKFDWLIPVAILAAIFCLMIGIGRSFVSVLDEIDDAADADDNSFISSSEPTTGNYNHGYNYNPLLGEWDWGDGGYAVINSDGTMYVYQNSSKNPQNVFGGTYEFSDKVETSSGGYLPNSYKITLTIDNFQENGKTVNNAIGEQNIFIFTPNSGGYYDVYNYRTDSYNRAVMVK